MQDTIYALSSGQVPTGVAVIRLSGPATRFVVETMCGSVPPDRHASLKSIRFQNGDLVDKGLVLFFPGPNSFTGEDCAELHLHGGRAVVDACRRALGEFPGLRHAEAGEFTRRAFENGKLDLTAAEGLADLIHAETDAQRRMALDQAGGGLAAVYAMWAQRLTHARAMIEAEFDFSDEEDIPGSMSDKVIVELAALASEISLHLDGLQWGEIVRDGFRVALIGKPNSGKSTLLNRLADREVAIVSDESGTTRDIVEVRLDLGGYLVILQDTAGIRESHSKVELEGIRRSMLAVDAADLVLYLVAPGDDEEDLKPALSDRNVIRILSKADLRDASKLEISEDTCQISAQTGAGIPQLLEVIGRKINSLTRFGVSPNRQRHRELLERCRSELNAAVVMDDTPLEIRAEALRRAGTALGRITGRVDVEDLLGVIFSEFCVGK